MWAAVEQSIGEATGLQVALGSARPVAGGSINTAFRVEDQGRVYFVKCNAPDRLPMFEAEALGLKQLGAAGSLRVPEVIALGADNQHSWLVLEYIEFGMATDATAGALGEQLAAMHRCSADYFGWVRDNTIGSTPQINTRETDWQTFYRQHRLVHQLNLASANGLSPVTVDAGWRLAANLAPFFSRYQPQPALLHGDLWGGNWAADNNGQPVIFDPALYFGDREADIAMTELFGGFDAVFYQAYQGAWPLDADYAVRKNLYNLYHVLNHFNLFGAGYGEQAGRLIDQLMAEIH